MADLLDEIEADAKEEKHSYITNKLVKFFIIAAIIIIAAVGIYVWKERAVKELQYNLGMWFNQAIIDVENDDLDKALIQLNKVIEYPHQQYAALAYLNKASILTKQNKVEAAQEVLLEMSKQEHFDKALRDLSKIIYLGNQLNNDQSESELTNDMLNSVCKDTNAWQMSGLQLKALYEIKRKNITEAKDNLNKIIDSKTANKSSHDTAANILNVISRTE
jgi:hypothetical protein